MYDYLQTLLNVLMHTNTNKASNVQSIGIHPNVSYVSATIQHHAHHSWTAGPPSGQHPATDQQIDSLSSLHQHTLYKRGTGKIRDHYCFISEWNEILLS